MALTADVLEEVLVFEVVEVPNLRSLEDLVAGVEREE
jgi:hypothetical protein